MITMKKKQSRKSMAIANTPGSGNTPSGFMYRKADTAATARSRKPYTRQTYGARVGERIRTLRLGRGYTMQALSELIAKKCKVDISIKTIYAWELGRENGGNDMPIRYVPMMADIFDSVAVDEWLPAE